MVGGHEHWLRRGGWAAPESFPACLPEIKHEKDPFEAHTAQKPLICTGRQARALPTGWRPDPEDRPILRGEKQ